MLLQTNSYIVPKDKRAEHARLLRRFRQTLLRLGCDHFEVYEQVGANWNTGETTGRFVQILRFRDRKHQLAVQTAERADAPAQQVVAEFCDLINFPYQQQQGLFAVGFYTSFLTMPPQRTVEARSVESETIDMNAPDHGPAAVASATGNGPWRISGDEEGQPPHAAPSLPIENLEPMIGALDDSNEDLDAPLTAEEMSRVADLPDETDAPAEHLSHQPPSHN